MKPLSIRLNNLKWLLLFYCFVSFSQNIDATDTVIFTKCEVTFSDGVVKQGYIHNFVNNGTVAFEDILDSSIEKVFGLLDNDFEFKTKLDERPINLKQKDVSKVKLCYENNEFLVYKLMNIKTLSKEGKIEDSSKKAWLPLYKEDIVSIFSFNIWSRRIREKSNGTTKPLGKYKKKLTITYLSNSSQNYALSIYNFDEFRIWNPNYKDSYLGLVLMDIFKDSPFFLSKIITEKKQWNYKLYEDSEKQLEEEIKRVKSDDLLDEEDRKNKINALELRKEANPFLRMIDDYKLNFYNK
jgi:hypothetical protein